MAKGKIIVIEGTDKAGKTTQSRMLAEALKFSGKVCVIIDFPDYTTPIGMEIKASLEEGDLVAFGRLLHKHWTTKKARSSQVSDPRIDRIYALARENGALGGKLMGAGGGGFLMLVAENGDQRRVREVVAAEGIRHMPFKFDLEGAKTLLDT